MVVEEVGVAVVPVVVLVEVVGTLPSSSNQPCSTTTLTWLEGLACSSLRTVALCTTTLPFCQWTRAHSRTTLGNRCEPWFLIKLPLCVFISILCMCSEYYFSDENLQKDFFLRGQVCAVILNIVVFQH